jgi:hypothetical protein
VSKREERRKINFNVTASNQQKRKPEDHQMQVKYWFLPAFLLHFNLITTSTICVVYDYVNVVGILVTQNLWPEK